jgi:acyl-coenzyme A synthetase/AMP-(fatty) acid ligase
MGSFSNTVAYGRRLLHTTADEQAETEPNKPWASLPYDDGDLSKGYQDITYHMLANAVNKMAWFIDSCLGPARCFETVCYIGRSDIRYQIMSLAVAKVQYKVLFSSHVHSAASHLALMERTETKALLTADGVIVEDILIERPMPHFIVPELDELLTEDLVKIYPYTKTFDQAAQDPYLILHTSGTTGLPKPILWNHAATAALDARALLPSIDAATGQQRKRIIDHPGPRRFFVPFRPFHGICAVVLPIACIFGGACYVPGLRHRLTTSTDLIGILIHARVDTALLSPAMIEDVVATPNGAPHFSKLNTLLYGGAPLNHAVAQAVSVHTNIHSQWGITEFGHPVNFVVSPEDYEYSAFDIASSGVRMEPVKGADNLVQMFIDRTPEADQYMALFHRQPELTTYDTGDLWEPHPDPAKAPFTFRFRGRADDLITYAEGSNVSSLFSHTFSPG